MLKGNLLVGQSGGPTAAINASLAGVLRGFAKARKAPNAQIFGMRNGVEGLLHDHLVDLTAKATDEEWLCGLDMTPGSALGSCRLRLPDAESSPETYETIFANLEKHGIRNVLYIGGNDSMDTTDKLSAYAKKQGIDVCVVGVPKTIDNDLVGTDHTPGFGSAAKFVATEVEEIVRDLQVYSVKSVTVIEIMGRDAGWLTAASGLCALNGKGADLIYLPEHVFSAEEFISDLKEILERQNAVTVCVSEGIRFADGHYVGEGLGGAVDVFGHKYLSGAGKVLESLIREKVGCKVRSIEFSLPQRCASHIASAADLREASEVGQAAVRAAEEGKTCVMMTIKRLSSEPYAVTYEPLPVSEIANRVKQVPAEYINERGNGITTACLTYLKPLILGERYPEYKNGMPKHTVIE